MTIVQEFCFVFPVCINKGTCINLGVLILFTSISCWLVEYGRWSVD